MHFSYMVETQPRQASAHMIKDDFVSVGDADDPVFVTAFRIKDPCKESLPPIFWRHARPVDKEPHCFNERPRLSTDGMDSAVLRSRAGEKECSRGNIVLAQIALSPSQCLGICQRKLKLLHDRVPVTPTSLTRSYENTGPMHNYAVVSQ